MTYYYEVGFKDYYKIPDTFVEVNVNTILIAFSKNTVSFIMCISLVAFLPDLIKQFNKYLYYVLFFCSLLISFYINRFNTDYILSMIKGVGIGICIIIFSHYLIVLIKNASKIPSDNSRKMFEQTSQFSKINKFHMILYSLIIIIMITPQFKYAGKDDAENQKQYLVIENPTTMVVIDSYKDYLILAPLDFKNKSITPTFQFVKQKEDANKLLSYQLVSIGKLKVNDPSTTTTQTIYTKP